MCYVLSFWDRPKWRLNCCIYKIISNYEEYLLQTGKTITNVRHHIHLISKFFANMEEIGITDISEMSVDHIRKRLVESRDKSNFSKSIKMFFRYAYKYGLIENNVCQWIPSPQRRKPLPSVYTVEEVEKIVHSVDRASSIGKRNFCIILLAARLGIRSCDITALKLDDIHRKKGIIKIFDIFTDAR